MSNETIFALSSGGLPSGVAVVRISGERTGYLLQQMAGELPEPRRASYRDICAPNSNELLDRGIVVWFPGPNSFTGEDCGEFQLHGGIAVVSAVIEVLSEQSECRLAEPGEFSRRAFENGKLDLTQAEGLADLISSQTEHQRRQALDQSSGLLREKLEYWRAELVRCRAAIEARLDFSDEDDVPDEIPDDVWNKSGALINEIRDYLDSGRGGEIVRDGFRVALLGPPNAGKSSLLNALAKRDVAIVSEEAGTTRDVIEVKLDLGGLAIIVSDTAGIRESENAVEQEGVRRALDTAKNADLKIWLMPCDSEPSAPPGGFDDHMIVRSKADLCEGGIVGLAVSTLSENGMDRLIEAISDGAESAIGGREPGCVSRLRHRVGLKTCCTEIENAIARKNDISLAAEHLRAAGDHIGRITGRIDVEDLLDLIFSEFCVGK